MADTDDGFTSPSTPNRWAIILAAGEGTRLAAVTRFLYGCDVPKQFAALDGDQTLLQRTVDRLASTVPPHRIVVVVSEDRRGMAEAQLNRFRGIQLVSQPRNIGTGPGVLLPLSIVRAQDRDGQVIVTPSDHHISAPRVLEAAVDKALNVAARAPAGLALLGADASGPVPDLGWIVPEVQPELRDADVGLVQTFVEKPPVAVANRLFRDGGLWNTLIVVGAVETLWTQAEKHMPRQTELFTKYANAVASTGGRPDAEAGRLLARIYRSMPPADFSRTVLQNAHGLAVVRLSGSGWCDCGTPERLLTCLDRAGKRRREVLKAILHSLNTEPIGPAPAIREV